MGRASQIIGYIIGFIVVIIGLFLLGASMYLPVLFAGSYLIIAIMIFVFGLIIIGLGHRSRPTKEKEMLKRQAEEYFRQQKINEEKEKAEEKEMKMLEKQRKREEKEMEKLKKEREKTERGKEKE